MPPPTLRKVFESSCNFNPATRWNTTGKTITPVTDAQRNKGFCLAMTCRRIKLSLQHGPANSAKVLEGRELLHISIVQSGYLELPNTYTGAKGAFDQEKLVYEQAGLKFRWTKSFPDATGAGLPDTEQDVYLEVGLPAHSVGRMLKDGGLSMKGLYFDPSEGLFEWGGIREMGVIVKEWQKYYDYTKDNALVTWLTLP